MENVSSFSLSSSPSRANLFRVTVVSEQILDRIPTTVKPGSAVFMMLAKEETIVLILNAFARQSIWNECLAVISELRKHDPRCGTTVSVPLSDDYIRKIGLLAKLVEGKQTLLSRFSVRVKNSRSSLYSFHRPRFQGAQSSYRKVFR